VSSFFPCNTLAATILDALIYFFFWVFWQFDYLDVTSNVSPENRWANIQAGFTIIAVSYIYCWNFHLC